MKNPTYLILSRHNIYYFRYPLPMALREKGITPYLKLSLGTKDVKEALHLSNILSYHARLILNNRGMLYMNHGDVIDILREYFYALVEQKKEEIHRSGPLDGKEINSLVNEVEKTQKAIDGGYDVFSTERELGKALDDIIERSRAEIERESEAYQILRENYKLAYKGYCEKVISHNHKQQDFSFSTRPAYLGIVGKDPRKNKLSDVIDKFIEEMRLTNAWGVRAEEERISCLDYLIEFLGGDTDVSQVSILTAREVKEALLRTPKNRKKIEESRDLPLSQQIQLENLETLSVGSINKYLQCFSALLSWAYKNGYSSSNPFEGMKLKADKKKKRNLFSDVDVKRIIDNLDGEKSRRNYWGVMIALYTGARLNEIASLTPDDVKQDKETGIWYFDINDNSDYKHLKTEASNRRVPIHSKLLDKGILDFTHEAGAKKGNNLRLLYDLTYSEKEGWGRKLGRWFNDTFLKKLALKQSGLSFHSIRHTVITSLRKAGVDNHDVRPIVGHEPDGVTEAVYNHGQDLEAMKNNLERLTY